MKRIFSLLGLLGCMVLLLVCSVETTQAVRDALTLCAQSVVPALFPFFVVSGLFISLGYAESISAALAPLAGRLFGCSRVGAVAFLLGIIGGYPIGGRTVGELYRSGRCSMQEAEHLLAFCNNAGPAFILGIAGTGCFHDVRYGVWLYLIHVAAAILTGILLGRCRMENAIALRPSSPSFVSAFVQAVRDGAVAMLQICGFVAFFLVLLRLLSSLTGLCHPLVLGCIELTSGIMQLSPSPSGFIWCAGLLGWGGLSVHCQTAAVLSETGLSMKRYFWGKLLQAVLSMLLAIPVSHLLFP